MFPNATMMQSTTWSDVLRLMLDVRSAHGWNVPAPASVQVTS
jgi:hypothetical protein